MEQVALKSHASMGCAWERAKAVLFVLAFVNAATSYPARAAEEQPLEYQVKAAFLLNFTKFVEWPASAFVDEHSPLAICIQGEDRFGRSLSQMVKGETVNGHAVVIERLRGAPEPKACQVLFVARTAKEAGGGLERLGPGVLTVGEGEKFLREGEVIAFVIDNRRVRFDINQSAAANAMLNISSKLMSVARNVEK
jgi:hypothetical protein